MSRSGLFFSAVTTNELTSNDLEIIDKLVDYFSELTNPALVPNAATEFANKQEAKQMLRLLLQRDQLLFEYPALCYLIKTLAYRSGLFAPKELNLDTVQPSSIELPEALQVAKEKIEQFIHYYEASAIAKPACKL